MQEINPDLRYRHFWLGIGYMMGALVVYLSITSSPVNIELGIPYEDKFFHALAYFAVMGWFAQIYHVHMQRVVFAVSFIVMGVSLEYIQSLDPARYSEIDDMIANTLGVAIAVLLAKKTTFRFLLMKFEKFIS